jgi:hypothetical protein
MSFRSFGSLGYLCDSLNVIASLRTQGQSLLSGVAALFDQPCLPAKERAPDESAPDILAGLGSKRAGSLSRHPLAGVPGKN